MNTCIRTGVWVGLAVMTTVGLTACNRNASADAGQAGANSPVYAKVVSATPIKKTVNHPTKECHDVAVTEAKPVKDKHEILGSAIGAVAGGLLGHQVGGGTGKTLATVAGAVGGAVAGHAIQKHHQENATQTVNKQVCNTVNHYSTQVVGYNVKYQYKGSVHTTRMDHNPGSKVQVETSVSVAK